jgi:glycosyltransferase involved in cell wall biosynthesis
VTVPSGDPLVSVVMPAYNAERTIGAAATSVLWQSVRELELIVVDDGSLDDTVDVVNALPGPVRLLRQENRGVAAARNAGIELARGEFIAFCDADDLLFETHLEALLDVWHRSADGGMATANAYWLLPGGISGRKLRHRGRFPAFSDQRAALLQSNFISTMSLLPRDILNQVGTFDETLRQAEDWELWLRIVFAGHRVVHQPRPLALYRWSTDGLSSQAESFYAAEQEVLRRVSGWPTLTAPERGIVAARLAAPAPRALLRDADSALRAGAYLRAAAGYRRAASLVPAENLLRTKSRLLTAAPFVVGPLLRRRLLRDEEALGFDEGHAR